MIRLPVPKIGFEDRDWPVASPPGKGRRHRHNAQPARSVLPDQSACPCLGPTFPKSSLKIKAGFPPNCNGLVRMHYSIITLLGNGFCCHSSDYRQPLWIGICILSGEPAWEDRPKMRRTNSKIRSANPCRPVAYGSQCRGLRERRACRAVTCGSSACTASAIASCALLAPARTGRTAI